MNGRLCYPIVGIPAAPHANGIHFQPPQSRGFIVANHVGIVWLILSKCDGNRSADAIASATRKELRDPQIGLVSPIMENLIRIGVLIDIQEAWRPFHRLTCQPRSYGSELPASDENDLASESISRRLGPAMGSARTFTSGEVDPVDLHAVLKAAATWQLPAGADTVATCPAPIQICLIHRSHQADLSRGYYHYDSVRGLLTHTGDVDDQQLRYAFNSDSLLGGAPAILVIAIHLHRRVGADMNRKYRTAVIEVGRAIQRVISAAASQGLTALERTEFMDAVLAEELGMDAVQADIEVLPAAAVAIGHPAKSEEISTGEQMTMLRRVLVGKARPVQKAWVALGLRPDEEPFAFFSAYARAHSPSTVGRNIIASGTGSSSDEALLKAIAEAYERFVASLLRVERSATAASFTKEGISWLDPRDIAPLTQEQYAFRPDLQQFDARRAWQWVDGRKIAEGSSIWIPVDLVFKDLTFRQLGRRVCAPATSSGVAAAFSEEKATERALLELVERHALMRSWFEQSAPKRIAPSALTFHCQRRINFWQEHHRSIYVLDMSTFGVAVAVAIMLSDEYPCLLAGAAASITGFDDAAVKAFRDVELHLAQWTMRRKMHPIDPENVRNSLDHARLYFWPDYLGQVAWLWSGDEVHTTPVPSASAEELYEKLDAIVINLSPQDSFLKVVRVLSPCLVPLTFGFGLTHYTHPAINRVSPANVRMPHYFA